MFQITSGPQKKAQKVVIYGVEGIGKSSFAGQFPSPMFIDTEGSTDKLDVNRLPKPTSWEMLNQEIDYIMKNPICETLVIDTADWAERLCIQSICAKHNQEGIESFGYGRGYTYLEEEFGRFLNKLQDVVDNVGINVVLTAHAEIKKFEQPNELGAYDRWSLKLQKKTAPLVKEWADMLLFFNYKTMVIKTQQGKYKGQGQERIMYTEHTAAWDAKNRDNLAPELPMSYGQIAHIFSNTEQRMQEAVSQLETKPIPPTQKQDPVQVQEKKDIADNIEIPFYDSNEEKLQQDDINTYGEVISDIDIINEIKEAFPLPNVNNKALCDLMVLHNVSEKEMQGAVAIKGYYPEDVPINSYDPGFIKGVLVGAWDQVYGIILNEIRKGDKA